MTNKIQDLLAFEFIIEEVEDGFDALSETLAEDGFPETRLADLLLAARDLVVSDQIPDIRRCWTLADPNRHPGLENEPVGDLELTCYLSRIVEVEDADLPRHMALNTLFGSHSYFDTVAMIEGQSQSHHFQEEHVTELSALRQACVLIDTLWRHVKTHGAEMSLEEKAGELNMMLENLDLDVAAENYAGPTQ